MVLVVVVVMAITSQVAMTSIHYQRAADREAELLFRGMAYQQAIESYYYAIPEAPAYPSRLDDLINDPRFLHRRHIRQLYPEPMEGEWSIIYSGNGRIMGVVSQSHDMPLKQANFPRQLDAFTGSQSYSDWQFVFSVREAAAEK